MSELQPGFDLYDCVLAGFFQQRTSISGWCRRHGIDRDIARGALLGHYTGQVADELRRDLLIDSGVLPRNRKPAGGNGGLEVA